jgi:hypothetical protein
MSGTNLNDRGSTALLGVLLALGLVVGGAEIKATRLSDRYVTVKGLVERKVKADLAIWPLSCKEAGDDLSVVYAKTESDRKTVLPFLDQQSIQSSEIELGVIRVVDTQADEYGGNTRAPRRYICRAVNHGADVTGRSGCGGSPEDDAVIAKGHRREQQSWSGIDLQIHGIEFHKT